MAFVDDHRGTHGVEPICEALPIAPSTCYRHEALQAAPSLRSACGSHFRSVSAVQPIFAAIDRIAAHCESSRASCSNTIRTARSRTSGEFRLVLFTTPSSHELG